jgi:PAS domain S-box-containing protein
LSADVTVAVFEGAEPVVFTDENGLATGFYPELLRHIFNEADEDIRFIQGLSYQEAYNKVLSGEIDILPAMIWTRERAKEFDFNKEVIMVSWSQLFIRPGDTIESVLDLSHETIGLMRGGQNGKNFIDFMESFNVPFKARYYGSFPEMVDAVLAGEVRGMVSFGSFARNETRLVGSSIIFSPTQAFLGIRKGDPQWILRLVDDAVGEMKDDEHSVYNHLMDKWLTGGEIVEVVPRWLYGLLAIAAFIFIAVLLFSFLLSRTVRQIRIRLEESETQYRRMFHAATDMISIVKFHGESKGVIVDVNEAMCQKTGFSKEELIGRDLQSFYPQELITKVRSDLRIIEAEGELLTEAYVMKLHDLADHRRDLHGL